MGCTICSPSLVAPNDNPLCIFVNVQGGETVCLRERGQEEFAAGVFTSEENAEYNHNGSGDRKTKQADRNKVHVK